MATVNGHPMQSNRGRWHVSRQRGAGTEWYMGFDRVWTIGEHNATGFATKRDAMAALRADGYKPHQRFAFAIVRRVAMALPNGFGNTQFRNA